MKNKAILFLPLLLVGCSTQTASTSNTALNICLAEKANASIQDGSAFTTPLKTLAQNISSACLKKLALEKAGLSEESVTAASAIISALKQTKSE